MRLPGRSAVVALLFPALFAAASAPARSDEIDDYVRAEMQRQKIPGLSLAIVRNGEVVDAGGAVTHLTLRRNGLDIEAKKIR
ncbi:MAG TPA: hypothetical protein VF121_07825 [Thermoanaerobaculia bacterium]|nr:hypothetical protein [Thermoanaerobaculia bacterium]